MRGAHSYYSYYLYQVLDSMFGDEMRTTWDHATGTLTVSTTKALVVDAAAQRQLLVWRL